MTITTTDNRELLDAFEALFPASMTEEAASIIAEAEALRPVLRELTKRAWLLCAEDNRIFESVSGPLEAIGGSDRDRTEISDGLGTIMSIVSCSGQVHTAMQNLVGEIAKLEEVEPNTDWGQI